MKYVIDILLALGLILYSPVILYRRLRHGRYRTGLSERFGRVPVRHGLQPILWIHAVSLGEVNAIRSLVAELAGQLPDYEIVISSTTDTGLAEARKHFTPDRKVFQFPLDFSLVVRRAFNRLRPGLVVLIEGEVWPNFMAEANRRGVPVVLLNGRMGQSKGYPRYKLIKPLARRLFFSRLTALAVQEQVYADRFIELGADAAKVSVTGTMKFDTAVIADTVEGADTLAAAVGLRAEDRLIVAGGTGDGEERLLLEMFRGMKKNSAVHLRTRLAIVPRKPERFDEVAKLIQQHGYPMVRRSKRPDGATGPTSYDAVILGDTMGELRKFYSLAAAAFVGRSLVPMGGSDMIEAIALGKPVAFGPHAYNFPQVEMLLRANACRQVGDVAELAEVLTGWLKDPAAAAAFGRAGQELIRRQKGASKRNAELVCQVLGRVPAERAGSIATPRLAE